MTPGTRRRGSDLEAAIFKAVLDQLRAVGYAKLSMEGVAAAAQTGKAALYRRWSSKEELVRDTLLHVLPSPADLPWHDSVRDDLLEMLGCWAEVVTVSHGTVLEVLKTDEGGGLDLLKSTIRGMVTGPLRVLILQALQRGVERGEVRPEAATPLIARVGSAMITAYCLDTSASAVPKDYIEQVVDEIVMPLVTPRT